MGRRRQRGHRDRHLVAVAVEADHETLTAIHALNVQQLELLEGQRDILELLRQQQPKD